MRKYHEDGMGWGGLAPSLAEREEEGLRKKLEKKESELAEERTHADMLVQQLKEVTDEYEYACFGGAGVDGFRNGENEDGDDFFPAGEESDADAIDKARGFIEAHAKRRAG